VFVISAIVGPVAPYNNLPINAQFFQPSQFYITAIALGFTTLVTTAVNNNYVIGQLVRLLIPKGYGCTQLNQISGYVLSLPAANQVQLSINSTQNVDTFVNASLSNKPQIVAVGDINTGITSTTGLSNPTTNIPGSFINISP
jgi:hypothetical protein